MFEKYKSDQPVAVETLVNSIKNNKLSHAYIFETNSYQDYNSFIMQFIKYIVCPNSIKNDHDEKECNICSAIEDKNYIELKVINSDTLQIKKEALQELQREFKNKALQGKKRIYLIEDAEKLNSSSSNTILKFLEEPEENIIAIIVVPSRYMLLDTIISRCQIISLIDKYKTSDLNSKIRNLYYSNYEEKEKIEELVNNDIENIIKIVTFLEKNKKETLLFTNTVILDKYNSREDILKMFELIKWLYYDALKYKTNGIIKNFIEYDKTIKEIDSNNSINKITNKINVIIDMIDRVKYNVNINLLIDKFVIEMSGKENVRCC